MKSLLRLALTLTLALVPFLAPAAHAQGDSRMQIVIPQVYHYMDAEGPGQMTIQDVGWAPNGVQIQVQIYQNGRLFRGQGTRGWNQPWWPYLSSVDFQLVSPMGWPSYRFVGTIPMMPGGTGSGQYTINGFGWGSWWQVSL
jgi:hypothetical protein